MSKEDKTEKEELTAEEFEKICKGEYREDPSYKKYYKLSDGENVGLIVFENIKLDGNIVIADFEVISDNIELDDCEFRNINIDRSNKKFSLLIKGGVFQNVTFKNFNCQKLEFEGGKFNEIHIYGGVYESIHFNVKELRKLTTYGILQSVVEVTNLFFRGGEYKDSIDISTCNILSLWILDGGYESFFLGLGKKTKIDNLYLLGGGFRNDFLLSGEFEKININGGSFRNTFEIYSGEFSEFNVIGGDFQNEFNIRGGTFENQLNFNGGLFNSLNIIGGDFQSISFNRAEFKNELNIHGGEIHDTLKLQNAKYQNIEIKSDTYLEARLYINRIEVSHNTYSNTSILSGFYNEIAFIDATNTPDSVVQISNVQVNQLSFENYGNRGYITFKDFEAKNHLSNTTNPDLMSGESPPEVESSFSIIRSSLGRTEFIGSDLNSFGTLRFENSNLLNTFFEGSKWPEKITAIAKENSDVNNQLRIAYGQLKKVAQNQGDMIQANRYYQNEINAYSYSLHEIQWPGFIKAFFSYCVSIKNWFLNILMCILNKTRCLLSKITPKFLKTFLKGLKSFLISLTRESLEKVTLFLNYISNNHGSSWGRAFIFTASATVVFYFFVCYSLGITPEFTPEGWGNFKDHISHGIFQFFLITHDVKFMEEVVDENVVIEYNSCTYLADIFGRIFISYGIYQFIQAFRKHGRR